MKKAIKKLCHYRIIVSSYIQGILEIVDQGKIQLTALSICKKEQFRILLT
jgi:hypothetical protein